MDLQQGGFYIYCNANSFLCFPGTTFITECRGERKITRTFIHLESIVTHLSLCLITFQAVNPIHFLHHHHKIINASKIFSRGVQSIFLLHIIQGQQWTNSCILLSRGDSTSLPQNPASPEDWPQKPQEVESLKLNRCYNKTELCLNEIIRFLALYN